MKRTGISFLLVALLLQALGQQVKPFRFSEETFDFGNIVEENGPVTHTFTLTNTTSKPVTILSVKPSCGCTTPEWSKQPLLPGMSGIVKAQFDPKGRPGYFHKSLTVTTDFDGQPITLYIKGQVASRNNTAASEYPATSGKLRFRSLSFNLGKIFLKDEFTLRNIDFINTGDKPVTFLDKVDVPSHIKVEMLPKSILPGQRGEIRIGYNGLKKGLYGFHHDKIVVYTDDEAYPNKEFTVYATLEDYFVPPSAEELTTAPRLSISEMNVDLGNIKLKQASSREIGFTNVGKSVLEIRNIQGNCSCLLATVDKNHLKPGESGIIKITFTPEDRKGTQTKAVTIYSNDPQNPVQRITISAYAE